MMQRMMLMILIVVVLSILISLPVATLATFTSPVPPPPRPPIQECSNDACVCERFGRCGRERDDAPAVMIVLPTPQPVMRVIAPMRRYSAPLRLWRSVRVNRR
jgi:hypothetical protein